MFASTFLSAATALFFFAPSVVLGAPVVTRDLAVAGDKVAQVQSFVAETKTKITVIATKLQATELTTTTVTEYVAGLTSMNALIADCKSKIDEVKYRTIGVHVGADVSVAALVTEVEELVEDVAVVLARVVPTVEGKVSLVVEEVQVILQPVVVLLAGTVNGLLLTVEGTVGGVLVVVYGLLTSVALAVCETVHITALVHV